jgi:signal transduction histidine kinase
MKNDIASPGKDGMIPEREAGMDWADQQRFRLTRGLVYLSIVIGILLFLRSFTDEKPLVGMAVSILVAVLALTALGCLYHGKITSSKVIIAITANLAVFLISLDAPIEKATYLLYIPNSMAAFLVFSGRQRLLTIVFGVAPVLFCLATFMLDDTVSHPFARDFFFNFMAAAACVLFQMFFLVSFHSKAELKAREKESNLNATIQSLNDLSHNMDRLIYSSSHDLRAPIATLKGLVYLLQDREQDIAKDLPDYLSKMEGTISRMDRIVSDLKYYSETKLGHATRMVFDLKSISEEVINDLELAMKENVTIVNEVAPILIETDREGLKFA